MRRISHDTMSTVFGVTYLGLMTNMMLVISCLPLVALLIVTDPAETWLYLVGFAPLIAPAMTGAFTVFRCHSDEGSLEVVRGFWRGWWSTARHALILGAVAAAMLFAFVVDIRVMAGTGFSTLTVPLLLMLMLLVIGIFPIAMVAIAEVPDTRLREVIRISAVLGVRRWYLTLLSLVILGSFVAFFILSPALAIGLAAGPMLYAVWANGRFTLKPAIVDDGAPAEVGRENNLTQGELHVSRS